MKNQFVRVFAVLSIFVIGIVLTSFVVSGDGNGGSGSEEGYVLVRTIETGGYWPSQIMIVWEDGSIETHKLKGHKGSNFEKNAIAIHEKLSAVNKKGYQMTSSLGGNSDNAVVNTYIFQKSN